MLRLDAGEPVMTDFSMSFARDRATPAIDVRPLEEADLDAADAVMRRAFGTFLGLPNPLDFMGDGECIRTRWPSQQDGSFAAFASAELVGAAIVNRWGRFGFVGPVVVLPEWWGKGIASRLMAKAVERCEEWDIDRAALFTFASSPMHVHLYQKFDFWPNMLTMLMSRPARSVRRPSNALRWSQVADGARGRWLTAAGDFAHAILPGLDLRSEINAVERQRLGETILLTNGDELDGLAICHCGAGSEAGSGVCFVKFGAVRSGNGAEERLLRLLAACDVLASERQLGRLLAGMNVGRARAYRAILADGFRADFQGVGMHWRNAPGCRGPDDFIIADLR